MNFKRATLLVLVLVVLIGCIFVSELERSRSGGVYTKLQWHTSWKRGFLSPLNHLIARLYPSPHPYIKPTSQMLRPERMALEMSYPLIAAEAKNERGDDVVLKWFDAWMDEDGHMYSNGDSIYFPHTLSFLKSMKGVQSAMITTLERLQFNRYSIGASNGCVRVHLCLDDPKGATLHLHFGADETTDIAYEKGKAILFESGRSHSVKTDLEEAEIDPTSQRHVLVLDIERPEVNYVLKHLSYAFSRILTN